MTETLFTLPLKPGKLNDYKNFMDECCNGSKKEEYKDLLIRHGLNRVKMWHRNHDGRDYIIFIHDMSDSSTETMKNWMGSTHPFDKWFNGQLENFYDHSDGSQPEFFCELDARN